MGEDASPTKRAFQKSHPTLKETSTPSQSFIESCRPGGAGPNIKLTSQSLIDLLGQRYGAKSGSYDSMVTHSQQVLNLSDLLMSKGLPGALP